MSRINHYKSSGYWSTPILGTPRFDQFGAHNQTRSPHQRLAPCPARHGGPSEKSVPGAEKMIMATFSELF